MATYSLSRESERDVKEIYRYTLDRFGPDQATAYHRSLQHTFEFIAENPNAGRARAEIDPLTRSFVHRAHIVFYEIREQDVFILRILHARQDPMRHLF